MIVPRKRSRLDPPFARRHDRLVQGLGQGAVRKNRFCKLCRRGPHRHRGTVIVIAFEYMEAAHHFYASDAFNAARRIGEGAADTDLLLVEGI